MDKQASSTAVPFSDAATSQASMSPVPQTAVGNKPAPGLTGPKGLAPRTNYSRVNSGSTPPADLGASAQKSLAPDTQSFLPHKVAQAEVHMTASITNRRSIQDMIKAAGASVQDRAVIAAEAERHVPAPAPVTKVASAIDETIPTAYVEKLAEAMEFILGEDAKEAAALGPGTGPNALSVSSPADGKNPFMPGSQGQSTTGNQPPKSPATNKPSETPAGPSNALETNAHMKHAGISIDELRKAASAKVAKKEEGEKCEGCGKEKDACSCSKTASHIPAVVDYFLKAVKTAEDAINPAHISAGAAVAPETSAAGQPGGAPAGGKPQGDTSLIASNDAAIHFTKGQAKSQPKSEVNKLLTEPALSAAHDKTLNMAFSNTPKAGVKIAESARAAAARIVLEKMAADAKAEDDKSKKKEKDSTGGGFTAPPVGGAAGAGAGM